MKKAATAAKPAKAASVPLFIKFDGDKKREPITVEAVNELMRSTKEKRKYEVSDGTGKVVFRKGFKG